MLQDHFKKKFKMAALPTTDFEEIPPAAILEKLKNATKECSKRYSKGDQSFTLLGKLNPSTLEAHLPSFARTRRILNQKLH